MTAPHRIALAGLPGSGKSAVAAAVATRLGRRCIDLDDVIEANAGRSPASILHEDGEPAFRGLELAALRRLLAEDQPVVIACGGGVMTVEAARRELIEHACVVWLDAPDAVLVERIGDASARPLLGADPAAQLVRLRAQRTAAYSTAHVHLDATPTVDDIASRLARLLDGTTRVDVPGNAYHVQVRPGALDDIEHHVPRSATRVALITDRALAAQAKRIRASLRRSGRAVHQVGLAGGERLKTWSSAGRLLQRLSRAGLRRGDCVVALGGGALGDLAGFVAATYLRGIAWVNVPATLLAMVDSAVGGKTGVNLPRGKNLAGAVWQPRAVVCDPELLASLSARAYRSAFAEIVKYCMISEDGLVPLLDSRLDALLARDAAAVTDAVRRCVAIKAEVVVGDERESGPRAVLNYGHTVGHALEAAAGYGAMTHGEAIAVGMRVAGRLSVRLAECPEADVEWQDALLRRCGFDTTLRVAPRSLIARIAADKKATADGVGWVLLERRGRPLVGQRVPDDAVCSALEAIAA